MTTAQDRAAALTLTLRPGDLFAENLVRRYVATAQTSKLLAPEELVRLQAFAADFALADRDVRAERGGEYARPNLDEIVGATFDGLVARGEIVVDADPGEEVEEPKESAASIESVAALTPPDPAVAQEFVDPASGIVYGWSAEAQKWIGNAQRLPSGETVQLDHPLPWEGALARP
jgi:hypothetical protein